MGKFFSKVFKKKMRIVMLGLDAAGKTTILYNLRLQEDIQTIPTVGFNVETMTYQNIEFNVWDIGGKDTIRALWRYYIIGSQGIIFVVDSSDRNRIDEAKDELHYILNDRDMPSSAILLIFANKQDLPEAMSPNEIQERLGLSQMGGRMFYVQPACGKTGDGLLEGLSWLSNNHR